MSVSKLELSKLDSQLDQLLLTVWRERIRLRLPADSASSAKDRSILEYRVTAAFEEIELSEMPIGWSWQRAVLSLAEYVVEQMLLELADGEPGLRH